MSPYFFGNGCWILAKKAGNVLKGFSLVQFVFDIDTVFKGKVLLVSWNILTHGYPSFYCLSERKITLPFLYERVNLYCAGVNSIFGAVMKARKSL